MTNAATNGKSKFLADVPSEIRELLDWSASEVLALVLVHHQKNPENTAAWLNLGLALRSNESASN